MERRNPLREITRMIVVLTAISVASGLVLSFVDKFTKDPIEYQKLKFVKGPAVLAVLTDYDNDPIKEYKKNVILEKKENSVITKILFPAKRKGKLTGVAFEVTGQGYHGSLGIMIGIDIQRNILTGMRVMTHSETPGLGARAVEPSFYSQFSGLRIDDIALSDRGGKINAISGATMTSQGVVKAVKEGMHLYLRSRKKMIDALKTG